jgi:hypothetical protein
MLGDQAFISGRRCGMEHKQRHVSYMRKLSVFSIFSFILINLAGCSDKVPKPTADITSPNAHLEILHPDTKEQQSTSGTGYKQNIDKTKTYFTTCKASDPQGLQNMKMKINAYLYCQKNENGAVYSREYMHQTSEKKDFLPDSENKVPTSGSLAKNLNGSAWDGIDCHNGFKAVSVIAYKMECKAENWSDMTRTESLTLINK